MNAHGKIQIMDYNNSYSGLADLLNVNGLIGCTSINASKNIAVEGTVNGVDIAQLKLDFGQQTSHEFE